VLMDQTKDCFRIVWYEIDVDKDYGGKHDGPEIDLTEVDELIAAVALREQEKKEAAKKAPKPKGKPKKKTPEEEAAEQKVIDDEIAADQKAEAAARKRAQDKLDRDIKAFQRAEGQRTPVVPPKYPPDNPPILDAPVHPANQKLYEKLVDQGHCGDRVFYTDGTMYNGPFVDGSKDGVMKGRGLAKEAVETLGFTTKTTVFKLGFDGGITLKKHDCFPEEDPDTWVTKDEELWSGEFRVSQEGLGTEAW